MGNVCCGALPSGVGSQDDDTIKFLSQVKLFKRLPAELLPDLASVAVKVDIEPGQVVIRQGDEGNEFFVIKSGGLVVYCDGKKVANLKSGDYFGETALLRDQPRTATITAETLVEAITISRAQFQQLGLHEKLQFPARGAVAGGGVKDVAVKPPSPKTAEEKALMKEALKKNTNLATMGVLDDTAIALLIDCAWKEKVAGGTEIIRQGDLNADYFYIVNTGTFDVLSTGDSTSAEKALDEAATAVGTVTAGGSFGELALLYFSPRAATVRAKGDAEVFVIDRMNFKKMLAKSEEDMTKRYVKYLDKVDLLSPLQDDEKLAIAGALSEMTFSQNELIFQQGETGADFYILVEGQVSVIQNGVSIQTVDGKPEKANFFGERALLNNEPRAASIKVMSTTAKTLKLDRTAFQMLLGPLEDLKKRGRQGASTLKKDKDGSPEIRASARMATAALSASTGKRHGNFLRKDLKRLGLLGCGGFGAVELVEHLPTKETFALKAMSKGYIVKSGMQNSVISEKNVQLIADSPFIVKLFETYNGDQSLYFLLELCLGGELYATYNKKRLYGKEDCAKFYAAGTVYAFDHLHSKKVIFRDLKPENLLLNENGRIKLTDMGLAKVIIGKTYTVCGTPDYFAPEIIASKGHTVAVDWWTLGILIFELLGGHPPFESATPLQIYAKVNKGISKVPWPKACKGTVEGLIKGLVCNNPTERLPMKKGDIDNIKTHAWYSGFDWQAMENLTLKPPYMPEVKNPKDMANFNARKEDMPPQIPYRDIGTGWDKDFATSQ